MESHRTIRRIMFFQVFSPVWEVKSSTVLPIWL